jgi:hypothetical protein
MPNIKEVSDGGPNPNTQSVKQMRESQKRGSEGQGTSEYSFAEKNARRNQGTGLGEGTDPQFSEAEAGKNAAEGSLPWE